MLPLLLYSLARATPPCLSTSVTSPWEERMQGMPLGRKQPESPIQLCHTTIHSSMMAAGFSKPWQEALQVSPPPVLVHNTPQDLTGSPEMTAASFLK